MPRITPQPAGGKNVCAFLDVLAFAEIGKPMLNDPRTDDGYRVIVGSIPSKQTLLDDYACSSTSTLDELTDEGSGCMLL